MCNLESSDAGSAQHRSLQIIIDAAHVRSPVMLFLARFRTYSHTCGGFSHHVLHAVDAVKALTEKGYKPLTIRAPER